VIITTTTTYRLPPTTIIAYYYSSSSYYYYYYYSRMWALISIWRRWTSTSCTVSRRVLPPPWHYGFIANKREPISSAAYAR